jgi:hypothetical protein
MFLEGKVCNVILIASFTKFEHLAPVILMSIAESQAERHMQLSNRVLKKKNAFPSEC